MTSPADSATTHRGTLVKQALCWTGMGALLVVCVWHRWYGFDIWYHLALGREVVELGSADASGTVLLHQPGYRNIYWVFQVLAWFVYSRGGMSAVTMLLAALWSATFALWARTANAFSFPEAGIPLSAAAIVACQLRFEERPEVFSYLFLALHLWFIVQLASGTINRRKILVWLASQVVWTNVHGYFFMGPAVLAFWLVCGSLQGERRERLTRGWQVLGGVSAATLASPFGFGAWATVFEFARYISAMRRAVVEVRPYPFSGYGWTTVFFWGWSGLIIIVALADIARRRRLYEPALGMAGVALGALSARNAPLAVMMSGPLLAQNLQAMARFVTIPGSRLVVPALVSVLAFAYTGRVLTTRSYAPLVAYDYAPGSSLASDDYPVSATEFLRATGFSGSVFAPPSDGSYLEWALPSVQPYADTRFIDGPLTSEYFQALQRPSEFSKLHARWNFDAVLINVLKDQTHLVSLLADSRTWTLVYADSYRCVLANRGRPAGAALTKGPTHFYTGQTFARPANYNAAGSWLQGFAEARRTDLFALALRQFAMARDFPQEFRAAARDYALKVGSAEIAQAAMSYSPPPK